MVEPKYYNTAGHPRIGSTTSAPENNLSPAAQAVSNASKSSLDWESGYLPNAVAAAALRSAAEQLSYKNELGLTPFGGHCQARDKLLAIASELDHE